MLKLLFFSLLLASAAAALLHFVLLLFFNIPPSLQLGNFIFQIILSLVLGTVYLLASNSKEFSSVLLVAIVLRLLSCLVFVLVLRINNPHFFKETALHFFLLFIAYTACDTWLATKIINKR